MLEIFLIIHFRRICIQPWKAPTSFAVYVDVFLTVHHELTTY